MYHIVVVSPSYISVSYNTIVVLVINNVIAHILILLSVIHVSLHILILLVINNVI